MTELTDERLAAIRELLARAEDCHERAHSALLNDEPLGVQAIRSGRAADLLPALIAETREVLADRDRLAAELEQARQEARIATERREHVDAQLNAVRQLKVWTNKDGRRFVFADELQAAVFTAAAVPAAPVPAPADEPNLGTLRRLDRDPGPADDECDNGPHAYHRGPCPAAPAAVAVETEQDACDHGLMLGSWPEEGERPPVMCVLRGEHDEHQTANGMTWTAQPDAAPVVVEPADVQQDGA